MEKKLNLNDISNLSHISESFSHARQDYIFSHLMFDGAISRQAIEPIRFEGLSIIVVVKGCINITANSNCHMMEAGSLVVLGPNDVISSSLTNSETVEIYALFLSHEFINSMNFDINIINPRLFIDVDPVLRLKTDEQHLLQSYFNLLHQCAVNNNDTQQQLSLITRNIGRNIVVALMYQLAYAVEKRHILNTLPVDDQRAPRSRKMNYVHEFMHLLQQHYRQERTVAFYAGKMCISPKYLSLLVREITGRTAAAIIDQYVINEAKNMLRFSGFTVQQVAYKLNFPNQSAFGKYFKHITGLSPTAFRSN